MHHFFERELGFLDQFDLRSVFSSRLLPPTSDSADQLRHLIKKSKYFLRNQQRKFSTNLKTLQSGYAGFDWFVSSIFLIMGGKIDRSWSFLSSFAPLLSSGYLWSARLHASVSLLSLYFIS